MLRYPLGRSFKEAKKRVPVVDSAVGVRWIVATARFWIVLLKRMVAARVREKRVLRVRVESLSGD